jgi:hypothetical protein
MDCLDESGHLHLVVILAIVQPRVNLNGMEIFRPFVFADVLFLYVKSIFLCCSAATRGHNANIYIIYIYIYIYISIPNNKGRKISVVRSYIDYWFVRLPISHDGLPDRSII